MGYCSKLCSIHVSATSIHLVMPWPHWWSSSTKDEKTTEKPLSERVGDAVDQALDNVQSKQTSQPSNALPAELYTFTQPQTLIAAAVLTAGSLGLFRFYKSFLRRVPEAVNIKQGWFRKRSILGKVTSVGDGDNFRIFHTPGGWLAGWGWLRRVPSNSRDLKHRTVRI